MKAGRVIGVIILLLAVGIALIPQFTNCQVEGKALTLANGRLVPMKCLWTARAEMAAGITLAAVGALMMVSRRRESLRNLAVLGIVLGVFATLLPTNLIGVCQTPMSCNIVMRPAMLALGSLTGIAGLAALAVSWKTRTQEHLS